LIVEGRVDRRVIPELIERSGIAWGETKGQRIVEIRELDGLENVDDPAEGLALELKASDLRRLGVIIDADEDAAANFQKVAGVLRLHVPGFPAELPPQGLVHVLPTGSGTLEAVGIWVMPDNRLRGMLETFLTYLVPDHPTSALWAHARDAAARARALSAPYKDAHIVKAEIHTWLAWQDEPGRQLHDAVKFGLLDARAPYARPFVEWFCRLFDLPAPARTL
jgi:hypothetical protein